MASKTFLEQHKDTIQIIYGTAMVVALYFGLSTKIELLAQKHNDDQAMNNFRISALEAKRTSDTETKDRTNYEKYAVLPEKILIKGE